MRERIAGYRNVARAKLIEHNGNNAAAMALEQILGEVEAGRFMDVVAPCGGAEDENVGKGRLIVAAEPPGKTVGADNGC